MLSKQEKFLIRKSLRIKLLILLVTLVAIVLMFPEGESIESEVSVGSIWIQDDLIATTSFPIYKNQEVYNREKRRAAEQVYPVFVKREDALKSSFDSLTNYNEYLVSLLQKDISTGGEVASNIFLSPSAYNFLKTMFKSGGGKEKLSDFLDSAAEILRMVYRNDILNLLYNEIRKDSIAIRTGRIDNILPKRNFQDLHVVQESLSGYAGSVNSQLSNVLIEYTNHFIRPNLIFSEKLTEEEVQHAQNKVSPNIGIVNENERIIAKHDRVTEEAKLKIDSYKRAKGENSGFLQIYSQMAGKFLHILMILALFIIYLKLFRKKVFADNVKLLLIAIIILFISFITFVIQQLDVNSPVQFLIILPAASMMLTIMFDSRIGFYGTVVTALIVGALRGNDYSLAAVNIFAGAMSAYTVRDIKNRTQVFRSFVYILIGYAAGIVAFGFERFDTWGNIMVELAYAASNALISPVLTFGMIIFFERLFKITTDLTLLELTDFNRPLLKELARNAPGTFTHSMTVGSLVERAAEAIDANPLLARVGAYYHDIGKSLNPSDFVENQLTSENRHENLEPGESVKLIIDHVKNGIELARQDDLPQEIIDFIPMHHGTLVISYFYDKALKLYGEDKVSIEDFRYPGPKPNTKETALVMLADACESTVRSITDPDPVKVGNVINSLIKNRVDDGQLDESPITLADIKKIKEAFLSVLLGQYHKRIRYPKQEEMENK